MYMKSCEPKNNQGNHKCAKVKGHMAHIGNNNDNRLQAVLEGDGDAEPATEA